MVGSTRSRRLRFPMKSACVILWVVLLSRLLVGAQATVPPPTLDREIEGKARQSLKPPPKLAVPEPDPTAVEPAETEDDLKLDFLFGVVVLTNRNQLKLEGVPRGKPVQVPEGDPLLNSEGFKEVILRHCQKPMSTALMSRLSRDIIRFYHAQGHMLVDVLYEPQDISNGMLQLTILEGKLTEIKMQDKAGRPYTNGYTDVALLKKQLRQREGAPVLNKHLDPDLDWLNRNPFRSVRPYFEPGGRFAESQLLLRVDDRRPFDVSLGYENTGSRETSEDRISAGFSWGKFLGFQDHLFGYQFTASPDFRGLRAHVATYTILLPWHHTLRVFGTYLDVTGEFPSGRLEGTSYQGSFRYDVPLPSFLGVRHEFSIGADFKRSDNDLIFNGRVPDNTPTDVFQGVVGYSAGHSDRWGQTAVAAQFLYSPGGVTERNRNSFYNASHRFAEANYSYARVTAERETRLWTLGEAGPDQTAQVFRWNLRGVVQRADGNLLASEQLGLGGYASVRGYDERVVSFDQGWLISNEIKTPALSPAKWVGWGEARDRLEFLFFWDYATGGNKKLVTIGRGERTHTTLSSVGPGCRYTVDRYLAVRFDYGFPLSQTHVDPAREDEPRFHLGVNLSY